MLLPQVVIDLVYEFNPEHREKFNEVLSEFKDRCFCVNCGEMKDVIYLNEDFCSSICYIQDCDSGVHWYRH